MTTEDSSTPAFPDCRFPTGCQCAARGYQDEAVGCLVDAVADAAAQIGVPAHHLFGHAKRQPRLVVLGDGLSILRLGDNGDLAADMRRAVRHIGGADVAPYDLDALRRMIRAARISDSLRGEAGLTAPGIIILHTRAETLISRRRLMRWLMCGHISGADAIWWQIALSGWPEPEGALLFGALGAAEAAMGMLRLAGGGAAEVREYGADVPNDDDLQRMDE